MIYEIPSSLIVGFLKPIHVGFLSSISMNTLSSGLQAFLSITTVGFFSSSTGYLTQAYLLPDSLLLSCFNQHYSPSTHTISISEITLDTLISP